MTKPDPGLMDDGPSEGAIVLKRVLICTVGGLALAFLMGMVASYSSAVIDNGTPDLTDAAILSAMLLAAGVTAFAMWRLWPRTGPEPVAPPPRVRNASRIMAICVALGGVTGFLLSWTEDTPAALLSSAPVNPLIAASLIVFWLTVLPMLTWLWWRQIDEHEAGAYRDGAMVALHAYVFATPAWWMASRAGWLPAQDPMIVFVAVCVLWSGVWFARRYG